MSEKGPIGTMSTELGPLPVQLLGQSGCRITFGNVVVYLDPYLSNSVQAFESQDLARQVPIPQAPNSISDADWVLITHEHIDHCDPETLPQIALASPLAKFIAPEAVLAKLDRWGIERNRLVVCQESEWFMLAPNLRVIATPAAHPEVERDETGRLRCVGFILDYFGRRIFHSGDTGLTEEVLEAVKRHLPIFCAFLPVNEQNFFRRRRGIIGNMSVREAFGFAEEIGAEQVVPIHWDMFCANEVLPEEIRAVYRRVRPRFSMHLSPRHIRTSAIRFSVIVRTLNEARYLAGLLESIASQDVHGLGFEVIVVDSGSTDGTVGIAESHGCRVLHIDKKSFSFGRSLNLGCRAALGDILVIVSGHCIPVNDRWMMELTAPILEEAADYSFGRQIPGPKTKFSEERIFEKYFPAQRPHGQSEFFCSNANAALSFAAWERLRFDEDLTGLEDMELAQRLLRNGGKVMYQPEAVVYHHHDETWGQIRNRYEREAIALQHVMPNVHVSLKDVVRYIATSVFNDAFAAAKKRVFRDNIKEILFYRAHQYLGVYAGNNQHRRLSISEREKYFYPT